MSENGWTDNELGLDWLKPCFEPATAPYVKGEYRLLLVDGHSSHVSSEFIIFAKSRKIECLCLPAHATHLLQPLDVGVFGPLAHSYKKHLESFTRFTTYNIDKVDFLNLVQKARKEAISEKNIESAWRATGLIPFHPGIVLGKLENRMPSASDAGTSSLLTPERRNPGTLIPKTPANVDQVGQIDELIAQFRDQTLDTPKLALVSKLIKGAKMAMADRTVLNQTNTELYEANEQKKKRANRTGKQYDGQGARHLSLEEVERRRQFAINKQKELEDRQAARKTKREEAELAKACKELMRLGPDLVGPPPEPVIPLAALQKPRPVSKTQRTRVNPQRTRTRKTVPKRRVRFAEVQVEQAEKPISRVSSRGRVIRTRRKS